MKKRASYLALCSKNVREFVYTEWEEDGVKNKGVWLLSAAPFPSDRAERIAILYKWAEYIDALREPDYTGSAAVLDWYGDYEHTKVLEQIAF